MAAIFIGGMQRALSTGWRQAVAPLLADYVDRLAGEIGTPPSIERARAITERLPVAVRIDGPLVRWASIDFAYAGDWDGSTDGRHDHNPRMLERRTADGHRVEFGLGACPGETSRG